jgi:putative Holliday junction resolvase
LSRFIGLDWGHKRVGVSVSDSGGTLAVGYAVWPTGDVFPRLERAVREEDVGLIVVGYPLTLRGTVGPKAREVDAFIRQLEERGYRVERCDERYTTQDASRALTGIGISQRKQRGRIDMSAAVLMLQSYLDAARHNPENSGGG